MEFNMRLSYHMYNYTDKRDDGGLVFKAEAQSTYQATPKSWRRYAAGISYQEIQEMWQTQLPLCQRARARKLLSFCQHAGQKSYHDLHLPQKPRYGQKSLGQLSKCPKNSGRDKQYQSRTFVSKGSIVEGNLWHPRWTYPP